MLDISEKLSGESAREYIIRILKMNIVNLNLEPGKSISEKEIGDELGVSRTPVREAFIKLSQEELLEIYPQKGTFVSLIDLNIVDEAKFIRATLERAVVRLACQSNIDQYIIELKENLKMQEFYVEMKNSSKLLTLDNEFHRLIFKACKKERSYNMIESMNVHLNRVRMLRLTASVNLNRVLTEHRNIISAISMKDSEKAEQIMAEHLTNVNIEEEILKEHYPKYFK
jgi:DNA-binding GntR family transcriptional regulator